jgi:hypothetical protein
MDEEEAFLLNGAPEDYVCPISMGLMTDPVIAPDGRFYQRQALQQCIDWARERESGRLGHALAHVHTLRSRVHKTQFF